jgi:hypothetical protein
VTEHADFQRKNPNADERQRKRRYEFIEREGIECALWPTLFWDISLTYTYERATDSRRVVRAGPYDDDDEEDGFARSSIW